MNIKMSKYIIVNAKGEVLCKCFPIKKRIKSAFVKECEVGKRSSGYGSPLTFNHYIGAVKNIQKFEFDGTARESALSEQEAKATIEENGVSIKRVFVTFEYCEAE